MPIWTYGLPTIDQHNKRCQNKVQRNRDNFVLMTRKTVKKYVNIKHPTIEAMYLVALS